MKIKEYRLQKNMAQKELAEQVNVECSAVSMWELGEAYPRVETLVKLSQIFGCSVDELLKEG